MPGARGHQLRRRCADDPQHAVGDQLERGRASDAADEVHLAQPLQHGPRRLQIVDPLGARQDDQRSAIDGWNAAHHRRLDELRALPRGGAGQFLPDGRTGGAHLHQGLSRRGLQNAGWTEVDLAHRLRAGHAADRDLGAADGIGGRAGDAPHVQGLGLALLPIPDRPTPGR